MSMAKEWWDKLRNSSGMSEEKLVNLIYEAERMIFEGREKEQGNDGDARVLGRTL